LGTAVPTRALAIGAAVLLGLTPAHFVNSHRLVLRGAPAVHLGWLLCLLTFLRVWAIADGRLAPVCCSVSEYHPAAYILMPLLARRRAAPA
jgi:hypothetical protein